MPHPVATVRSVGSYLPGSPVPAARIDEFLGEIPGVASARYYEYIERFAGIRTRHIALERFTGRLLEDAPTLAAKAARTALARAQVEPAEVDAVITTSTTPPHLRGGLAKDIRIALGIDACATFDLWGACTGAQQAITLGTGLIAGRLARKVLLVGVELPSTHGRAENYAGDKVTREDLLLRGALGDGAGAMVLAATDRPEEEGEVLYTRCGTEGTEPSAFHRAAGGSTMPLNPSTFAEGAHHWRHDFERLRSRGRSYFYELVMRASEAIGVPVRDFDHILPAAANFAYFTPGQNSGFAQADIDAITERTFVNFADVGNIPSAAIYVALDALHAQGRLRRGTRLLLCSVEGATWGWGATALRWGASDAAAGA